MAYLAFNLNDGNEFVFDLLEARLTLGRDASNDIVIDNTYISGHHAEFLMQADGLYEVVDLKSSNGTYVNGKRIDRAKLKGGDRLRFGQLSARFIERAPKGLAPEKDGSKKVSGASGTAGPSREDGRLGDTESILLRDLVARVKTGKVELQTRAPVSRDASGTPISGAPEAVVSQELERLRKEVADLESRRDAAKREEAEAIAAAKQETARAKGELTKVREEMEAVQAQVKLAKAEADKLTDTRRELANLESKKESTLRELAKVQADVGRAEGSLKTVHEEVDQLRAKAKEERSAVEQKRAALTREEEVTRDALERIRLEMQEAQKALDEMRRLTKAATETADRVEGLKQDEQTVSAKVEAKAQQDSATTDAAEYTTKCQSLRAESDPLDTLLAGLVASSSTTESDLKQWDSLKEQAEQELVERQAEVKVVTERLQGLKTELAELEALKQDKGEISQEIQTLQQALQTLRAEQKAEDESLVHQRREQENLQKSVSDLQTEVTTLESRQGELLKAVQDMEGTLEKAGEAAKTLEFEVARVTAEAERLRAAAAADLAAREVGMQELESKRVALVVEVEEAEKKLEGLNELQQRLDDAILAFQVLETVRQKEEDQLAVVTEQLEISHRQMNEVALQLEEKSNLAAAAVSRFSEAEAAIEGRLSPLKSQVEELETELIQVTKAKDEQTAALSALEESLKQQEVQKAELEERLGQLTEAAQQAAEEAKRVEDMRQQKTELEEALAKAAETTQIELARVQSAKDEAEKGESELTKLRANIASLEEEEKRLSGLVGVQRNDLYAAGVALEALRQKQSQMVTQVLEFTRGGEELISVGEALPAMTARKDETQKSLKAAAEKELELQVRLGALQEAVTRETTRVETVVKERAKLEAEFQAFMEKVQAEAQKLREERAVLTKAVEVLKGQQAAFAEAEAQMKQWDQIEQRLRGQLEELEEKHEVMRVGLAVDESTVLMFANDLIKRLDLIDALRHRYSGMASGDVAEQLYTLRASVEDVLLQHGIVEFDVEPGTVVDVDLRKRITVVDAVAGKERARVVETFRTGFLRVMNDGDERILRKVEVRTSSQG